MIPYSNYLIPASLPELFQYITSTNSSYLWIAGGTDVLLEIDQGRRPPVNTYIDLTRLPAFSEIQVSEAQLRIGACATIAEVANHPVIRQNFSALADAAALIGGPQVRNCATLGGNIAHALPAADGAIALTALDARLEIVASNSTRSVPIETIFAGPGKNALQKDEVIRAVLLTITQPGAGSAFQRIMRPQGVALPILNTAVWLKRVKDQLTEIHIAISPSGTTPHRARDLESQLCGIAFDQISPAYIQKLTDDFVHFRTSPQRATAGYRSAILPNLLFDTIQAAWKRSLNGVSND
jgi:carbon-monoxide dehydrogenase medium subunit